LIPELAASPLVAFGISFVITPVLVPGLIRRGITGVDIHKLTKPICAEMGGVPVLLGFAPGIALAYLLGMALGFPFWAAVLTLLLVALVGGVDDLWGIRQRYKPFLIAFATIPLILAHDGGAELWLPFLGTVDFGWLYPVIAIPLMVSTLSNFSNMHAGFNGLEAGVASIGLAALGGASLLVGALAPAILALTLAGAFAGFLRSNWYPAKIFPGDVGTLTAGAGVAVVGVLAKLEFVALMVSIPAAFDFALKMLSRRPFGARQVLGDTVLTGEGFLRPPPYPSLSHAFMRVSRLSERELVRQLLFMEALYAGLAVALVALLRGGSP